MNTKKAAFFSRIFSKQAIRKIFKNCIFRFIIILIFIATSCDSFISCVLPETKRLSIMSYNAETFFDAVEDGVEFEEFKGGKSAWSLERYEIRLDRIKEVCFIAGKACGLMPKTSPDIIVLQEVENEFVIKDIASRFTGHNAYPYLAFIIDENPAAFGIGLLSRHYIKSIRSHQIESFGLSLRPLMEVIIQFQDTDITIFAVHWKSKAGNTNSVDIRNAQEDLLLERISILEAEHPHALWCACGDFNQTLYEFNEMKTYLNIWDPEFFPMFGLDPRMLGTGSYYYAGAWEGIDHFFFSKTLTDGKDIDTSMATVVVDSTLLTSKEIPFRYDVFSGKGYSDHLPIVSVIEGF